MLDIKVVIGLPGSGKSTMISQESNQNYITIDDWGEWDSKNQWDQLKLANSTSKLVYVSSIDFCITDKLNEFIAQLKEAFKEVKFDYIYFENNPHKCVKNILSRSLEAGDTYVTENGRTYLIGMVAEVGEEGSKYNLAMWQGAIYQMFKLSPNYIIPEGSKIINITTR